MEVGALGLVTGFEPSPEFPEASAAPQMGSEAELHILIMVKLAFCSRQIVSYIMYGCIYLCIHIFMMLSNCGDGEDS